jgi:hypothetical protein
VVLYAAGLTEEFALGEGDPQPMRGLVRVVVMMRPARRCRPLGLSLSLILSFINSPLQFINKE